MIDLRAVNKSQFSKAKYFWGAATLAKLCIFAFGLMSVLADTPFASAPQWILGIAVISEILQTRSDALKSRAESLLRLLDMCRSFGRVISESDKRDIIASIPRKLRKRFSSEKPADFYFNSEKPDGPQRAVENLYESAWYTGHLSHAMLLFYLTMISAFVIVSIFALITALQIDIAAPNQERVIRAVTAWLMLIFSLNMVKGILGYINMYLRCEKTKAACLQLMSGAITESDAVRQWHEYHISRSASPLIPDWLWKFRQSSLNDAWQSAREAF